MSTRPRSPEQKARRAARDRARRDDRPATTDPTAVEREGNSGWLDGDRAPMTARTDAIAVPPRRRPISDREHTRRLARVLTRRGIYSEEGHRLAQLGLELERLGALADLAAVKCALADLRRGGGR